MRRAGTFAAIAGLAGLCACQPAASGNAVAEANAANPENAIAASPLAPGENGAEGKPAPEPITAEWFAGRWSTDSDCSSIAVFSADGRFVNTVGERGTWSIANNRLTLTFEGQSATIPMVRIDERTLEGIGDRGRTRQYRC
ncbi:MAG TPA: hypothetical protein VLK25_03815 [Allosphingosinicella sp.]|nr:hypothetical protein [Allosphingosinicella sp.]